MLARQVRLSSCRDGRKPMRGGRGSPSPIQRPEDTTTLSHDDRIRANAAIAQAAIDAGSVPRHRGSALTCDGKIHRS